MRRDTLGTTVLASVLGLGVLAMPAPAQDTADLEDGRWLPFLGCWVDVEALQGPMTCIVPDGEGVAMLMVAESEVVEQRQVRADGRERAANVAGCTGVEAAEFSADGRRVFTRAMLECGAAERRTRGIMAMVGANQWIEARALGVEDGGVAWVKRYRLAPATRVEAAGMTDRVRVSPQALEVARAAASAGIGVDDLIEANAKTHPEAVRAWIAEHGQPLRLDADRLVRLADAGVPSEVIDVAVAVSFPERFAVARAPSADADRYGYGYQRFGSLTPWNPYYYDPFYYGYGRYSSYYGGGWYGPGYIGYRPTVVVVSPTNTQTRPDGRLIRGQGYTAQGSSSGTARRPSIIRPPSSSGSQIGTSTGSSSSSGSKGKAKRRGSSGGGG